MLESNSITPGRTSSQLFLIPSELKIKLLAQMSCHKQSRYRLPTPCSLPVHLTQMARDMQQ